MIKVFKSIMAAFLVAVMVASCSNGSSDGNSTSLLAGTVWGVGGVYLYLYEDGICSLVAGSAQPGTYDESTKTIHITSFGQTMKSCASSKTLNTNNFSSVST